MTDWTRELEVAVDAARAGARAVEAVERGIPDRGKVADHASEAAILGRLRAAFPQDGILSEETEDDLSRLERRRAWIVDPLDGTREYGTGLPEYAVSVALVEDGEPVVGVVAHPPTGLVYRAAAGGGSFLEDRPLRVGTARELARARVAASRSSFQKGHLADLVAAAGEVVPLGSIAWRLALVAAGEYDLTLSVHGLHEWDYCGGHLVLAEAGGTVLLPDGSRPKYNRRDPHIGGGLLGLPSASDGLAIELRKRFRPAE